MASVLILVLFSAIGWQVTSLLPGLSPLIWTAYLTIFPSQTSSDVSNMKKQQKEILRIRKDMAGTSSQDEFAKWAKLRREHDKKVAELEKLSSTIALRRQTFNGLITSGRWTVFTAIGFFLQLWYRKQPVFWLPRGWLPQPVEWALSLPQAPQGSVSVNVWSACAAIVAAIVAQSIQRIYNNPQPGQVSTPIPQGFQQKQRNPI